MTRSVLRYLKHRITQQPDTCMTFEAECMTCDCRAEPLTDGAGGGVECMSRTGRTGRASRPRTSG